MIQHNLMLKTATALLWALVMSGCTAMPEKSRAPEGDAKPVTPTTLATCPASPNCVCSADADRDHYIEPLTFSDDVDAAWEALRDVLESEPSIRIVTANAEYIRAEARTRILRFTDDVEFLLDRAEGVVHMRSASRVGYSDLGKNRKRLEGIRSALSQALTPGA